MNTTTTAPPWTLLVNSAIAGLEDWPERRFSRQRVEALRPLIPYCLHSMERTDRLILLNRDYKPLGATLPADYWCDYGLFPWLHLAPNSHAARVFMAHAQPHKNRVNWEGTNYYLFDDGCPPWRGRKHAERLLEALKLATVSRRPAAPPSLGPSRRKSIAGKATAPPR